MRDTTKHSLETMFSNVQNSSSASKISRLNDVKGQSETYSKLLTLDSAFYQPNRWQSKYVRKLTTALSIKDSRRRMLESEDNSMILQTLSGNPSNGSCSLTTPQSCCQCQYRDPTLRPQESSRRARPTTIYFANDGARTSNINTQPQYFEAYARHQPQQIQSCSRRNSFIHEPTSCKMSIQAAHQFSTIKTIYNDDRRTYEGIVQPHKPMLIQVDFEVSGDVSGEFFLSFFSIFFHYFHFVLLLFFISSLHVALFLYTFKNIFYIRFCYVCSNELQSGNKAKRNKNILAFFVSLTLTQ